MPTDEISVEITDEKDKAVNQSVDTLTAELGFLRDLDVAGRKALSKMGRRNVDLVERTYQYAENNKEFTPAYISLEEFKKDVDLARWLRKLEKKLNSLLDKIVDTAMLAESDAYKSARLYYKSAQTASNAGDEKAELIVRDLGIHFKKLGPKNSEEARKKQKQPEPQESPSNQSQK